MYISQTTEIRIDTKDVRSLLAFLCLPNLRHAQQMLSASMDANFEGFGFVREGEVRGGTKED